MPTLNSIRARLTLAFTAAIALVVGAVCLLMIWYSSFAAGRTIDNLLQTTLRSAENALADRHEPRTLREWVHDHSVEMDAADLAALIYDTDGRMVLQTQPTVPAWPRRQDGWKVVVVRADGETLVIGYPWWRVETGLRSQAALLALLGLVMIVVSGAACWAMVGQTLWPIRLLSRQAQAASTDNLRLRLEVPTQDAEVAELVTTLNGLLARLADTAAARGRFYAAASHELRTPLQALSGHLELALNRERDAAEYRSMLEEARIQTQRLTALARDLLLLNRLETSALPACETVEISELCERLLTHFQSVIARRQLFPHISLIEEAFLVAPPLHVEMLIRNLIENASKYASPAGFVAVSLTARGTKYCLEVFNSFPAEPKLDTQAIFEPFYRPDASRNSETGGNGLGLAICRALAAANQWRFDWRHDDDGIRATVWFPMAA